MSYPLVFWKSNLMKVYVFNEGLCVAIIVFE